MPQTIAWIEAGAVSPQVGWRMKLGTITGDPPADAEKVRRVDLWNDETFDWGQDDIAIVTG
jgi:hypothetical protein